jgi:hypothetical protein
MKFKKLAKILALVSVAVLMASFVTCRRQESVAQAELAKLSPAEREKHQFDRQYVEIVLPGILMFFAGTSIGFGAVVVWIVGIVVARNDQKSSDHGP